MLLDRIFLRTGQDIPPSVIEGFSERGPRPRYPWKVKYVYLRVTSAGNAHRFNCEIRYGVNSVYSRFISFRSSVDAGFLVTPYQERIDLDETPFAYPSNLYVRLSSVSPPNPFPSVLEVTVEVYGTIGRDS